MRALVVGGTGLVGNQLLLQLAHHPAFDSVVSLGRSPLPEEISGIDHRIVDLWDPLPDDLRPDVFFCALGTTIKNAGSREAFERVDHDLPVHLAREARQRGASTCVVVSSMGADPDSRVFYNQVKGRMENDLERLGFDNLSIVRPSLLLGDRKESRPGEEAAALLMQTFSWLIPKAWRAVRVEQVARAMILMATTASQGNQVLENSQILDC